MYHHHHHHLLNPAYPSVLVAIPRAISNLGLHCLDPFMAPAVTATVVDDADPQNYENEHVHAVYDEIAPHFSSTRYKVRSSLYGPPGPLDSLMVDCTALADHLAVPVLATHRMGRAGLWYGKWKISALARRQTRQCLDNRVGQKFQSAENCSNRRRAYQRGGLGRCGWKVVAGWGFRAYLTLAWNMLCGRTFSDIHIGVRTTLFR